MIPAPGEHRHTFDPATIRLQSGPTPGGRCPCGVEVVGPQTAPFRLNAALVRSGETVNQAAVDGLTEIGRRLRAAGFR